MNCQVIAFYLPQYHPVKENDEWFGKGFTEWTNVAKSKPLFKNHYQPRIPKDLGFYDLRIPEVREEQAILARRAGISAFCYYHYWFGDRKVILERPLQEVIKTGEPDFPFCICWANHSWYKKNWNPDVKQIEQTLLVEQTYPGDEDIVNHFNFLLPAFKDKRYFKVDGRLLFVIYNLKGFQNFPHFKSVWNKLALENDLPEFYFIGNTSYVKDANSNLTDQVDGLTLSLITNFQYHQDFSFINRLKNYLKNKASTLFNRPLQVYEYGRAISKLLDPICKEEKIIPVIVPNWDYTPRRGVGGLIFKNSTPELFAKHVREALEMIKDKNHQLIFLKSWNEWGEGNYMEPDLRFGTGYIDALRKEIDEFNSL